MLNTAQARLEDDRALKKRQIEQADDELRERRHDNFVRRLEVIEGRSNQLLNEFKNQLILEDEYHHKRAKLDREIESIEDKLSEEN